MDTFSDEGCGVSLTPRPPRSPRPRLRSVPADQSGTSAPGAIRAGARTPSVFHGVPRRGVLQAASWTLPAVAVAAAAPAAAVSGVEAPAVPPGAHGNVVVVVRFQGDARGDGETGLNTRHSARREFSEWDFLRATYAPAQDPYLRPRATWMTTQEYFRLLSNGTYELHTTFPQTSGERPGTVTYLTLPRTYDAYRAQGEDASVTALVSDTVAALSALPGAAALAAAGDLNSEERVNGAYTGTANGEIDNLSILLQVPEGATVGSSRVLTSRHTYHVGAGTVGGRRVGHVNILPFTVSSTGTWIGSSAGGAVIEHEYVHTIGPKDLYRPAGQLGTPVGAWDLMARAAYVWPLAQTLVDMGFATPGTCTDRADLAPGTHRLTLSVERHGTGPHAVRLRSPLAADEWFVIELRQRGYVGDRQLPGAGGVIIYRVNEAVTSRGNLETDAHGKPLDYIYVFRPGETGLHDAAGQLSRAALSQVGSSFGTADLGAGVADGAIVTSRAQSTGMTVTLVEVGARSCTVEVTVPDLSSAGLWTAVPGTESGLPHDARAIPSLAAGSRGLYVGTVLPSGKAVIHAIRQGRDEVVTPAGTTAVAGLSATPLAVHDDRLYILSGDGSRLAVGSGEPGAWQWRQAPSGGTPAALTADGSGVSASYLDGAGAVRVLRATRDSLTQAGSTITSRALQVTGPRAVTTPSTTLVALSHFPSPGFQVLRQQGSDWQVVHSHAGTANGSTFAQTDTTVWHMASYFNEGSVELVVMNPDGTVREVLAPEGLPARISWMSLRVAGGTAYLATCDDAGALRVMTSGANDMRSWTQLGQVAGYTQVDAAFEVGADGAYLAFSSQVDSCARVVTHPLV